MGKPVVMTTFVEANLYHDLVNGRSVTGILHVFNKTVINWYSKQQSTVKTATYGSEFVAACTAMSWSKSLICAYSYDTLELP